VKLAETGNTRRAHTRAVLAFTEAPGNDGQTPQVPKAKPPRNKSRSQTQLHSKAISTPTAQKFGALGLGDGDASKVRNPYRHSSVGHDTRLSQDGSVDAVQSTNTNREDEGNIMELTTDEIIARLMNLSVKLDGEMRFDESSTVSQAIALIMTLRNAAERLRHPSNSDIVSAIRSQNTDELKAVIEWIVENPS